MEDLDLARQMLRVRWIAREQGVYLDDAVVTLLAVRMGHDPEGLDIHTRAIIANSRMMGHGLSFATVKAWLDQR
ncbi:hypothetical protein G3I13_01940 [Streptomyces sp. SID6673]|nr:hypothetical protein [Streptomyces sp. SID11726]NDZ94923.1 hypothetical protein [Streptomyces sp. SID11726]NEB23082.1 hypothetical protein [Streptomyces sp. SID6673]